MLVRAPTSPLRTKPRVQRAPGIPCALHFRGRTRSNLGRIAPRDREGMSGMKYTACRGNRRSAAGWGTRIPAQTRVADQKPLACSAFLFNHGGNVWALWTI